MFSFADLIEKIRDHWRATVLPSWKNLLSEKQNTANVFTVILLLELLLCIIFTSFSNNLSVEDTLNEELDGYRSEISQSVESGSEQETVLSDTLTSLSAHIRSLTAKNTAIFLFTLAVWFLVSFFIFSKIIASSTELKKFVYGLYITFGANTKKIRSFIFCQMLTLAAAALIAALPLAQIICSCIYGFSSIRGASARFILPVLLGFSLLMVSVIAMIAYRITSKSCVSLLASSDVSNYVRSPRKSSFRIYSSNPMSLASIAIRRMRSHYIPLVISAVLPACLFFCCMSLVKSNNLRKQDNVVGYSLEYADGITKREYFNVLRPELEAIDGVAFTAPNASAPLGSIAAHLMFRSEELNRTDGMINQSGSLACGDLTLVCGDDLSMKPFNIYPLHQSISNKGDRFGVEVPKDGSLTVLYPKTEYGQYPTAYHEQFVPVTGDNVFISYADSRLSDKVLSEVLNGSDGSGISFTVNEGISVNDKRNSSPPYGLIKQRLQKEVILLSPSDYEKITGLPAVENIKNGLPTPSVTLSEIGSYLTASELCFDDSLQTVPSAPVYMGNGFILDVADEFSFEKYNLQEGTALPTERRTATLILSSHSALKQDLSRVRISGVTDMDTETAENEFLIFSSADLLQLALKNHPQYYTSFEITSVVLSDSVTDDVLLLQENDMAELFGRQAAYNRVDITIPADLEIPEIASVLHSLKLWELTPLKPVVTESAVLWDSLLVDRYFYNPVAAVLAVLLLLSVPFIWFCPQFNHYRKRKSDLEVIVLLGQRKSKVLSVFLCEGLILALLAAVFTLLFSPVFTFAVFEFFRFNGFPFAYSALDTTAFVCAILYSMLCAFASTVINYPILFASRKDKFSGRKPADPSVTEAQKEQ